MVVGIPKEIMKGERRVSAIPETVEKMAAMGMTVLVQKSAGQGAFYSDEQYAQAGAVLVEAAAEIFQRADIILKVKEPQYDRENQRHEVDLMRQGQVLITFIHPAAPANHDMVRAMAEKGVVSLTLDGIPRISRAQSMDALTSMSTCAGYKGFLMAADNLSKFVPQIFCAVGMLRPIQALIVGAGVGGLQAIATAKRLGAVVYAMDIRPDAVEQARSLGAKIIDTTVPGEIAVGTGGYANSLPAQWLDQERQALGQAIRNMDIVFCSALVPGKQAPLLITEDMVREMTPGSVIVDISIDQGGNCAVTTPGEVCTKHGVVINGIKNIPGLLPTSSTWMFAHNIFNLLQYLYKDGRLQWAEDDEIVAPILTTTGGKIVHPGTLEAMGQTG